MQTRLKVQVLRNIFILILLLAATNHGLSAGENPANKELSVNTAEIQATTEKRGTEADNSGADRKRFLEIRTGEWRIGPGLAFKFGKGYNFAVGPKLNIRRRLDDSKTINFSTQYLPLTFKDASTDGKLGVFSASANFRHYFRPRFFYELGVGINSFRPDSELKNHVAMHGAKIDEENILNGSFSLAYQLFHIPYSYKKKSRKILFYLKLTWREGDQYEFGTDIGNAGNEYRNGKSGLSIRLYPLLRRF